MPAQEIEILTAPTSTSTTTTQRSGATWQTYHTANRSGFDRAAAGGEQGIRRRFENWDTVYRGNFPAYRWDERTKRTVAATVDAAFNRLLADVRLTARQRLVAQGRIRGLRSFFAGCQASKAPQVIGSFGRGTIIRFERDIDVMVVLRPDPYWERYRRDYGKFLSWLREALSRDDPDTGVSTCRVAPRMESARTSRSISCPDSPSPNCQRTACSGRRSVVLWP